MAGELNRFFANLPQVFKRDPLPRPAISIAFFLPNLQASMTLSNHTMTITISEIHPVTSPFDFIMHDNELQITIEYLGRIVRTLPVTDLTYNLREFTLERFVEDLNNHQGFTATILDTRLNKLLAAALVDTVEDQDLLSPFVLSIATNPLWIFGRAFAFAIEDHANNIDEALAQLNILQSKTYFADFWGRYTYPRIGNESDTAYTQRIVDSILTARDNDKALEIILEQQFGLDSTITNLWPTVLNVNNSRVSSKIPGEVFNATNFLVTTQLTGDPAVDLVNQNRAGGTRAFFSRTLDREIITGDGTISVSIFDLSLYDPSLSPEQDMRITLDVGGGEQISIINGLPDWKVGIYPMPGTKIG